jgi:SNARE protein
MQVGTRAAETLQAQGEQMERVLDTLHEIQFSMKKAGQVIRDITRGIATDKCERAGTLTARPRGLQVHVCMRE